MFVKFTICILLNILVKIYCNDSVDHSRASYACNFGDVIENAILKCTCTQKSIYHCEKRKSRSGVLKGALDQNSSCHSSKIYQHKKIICICNEDGSWPHENCAKIFNHLPYSGVKSKCTPNSYVTIDCNVCRCDSDGSIDKKHCTQNQCDNEDTETKDFRRSSKVTKLFGHCETKNWYSLAPCQFCYCVNKNKLVCNTGTNSQEKSKPLTLGAYKLNVCGRDLITEANDLIPDSEENVESNPLRFGSGPPETTPRFVDYTSPKSSTIPKPKSETNHIVIDVDFNHRIEQNVPKKEIKESQSHEGEASESESEDVTNEHEPLKIETVKLSDQDKKRLEKFQQQKNIIKLSKNEIVAYKGQSTKLPYQEDAPHSEDSDESEKAEEDEKADNSENDASKQDNGHGLNIPAEAANNLNDPNNPLRTLGLKEATLKELGNSLKFSLPLVLDKVLQLALRKSMVTLSNDTKCIPGSVKMEKCNTCYCLKNNKMLCTNTKCKQ